MGISSAGIGSGLDVNSLVSQLMQLERQPLDSLSNKKSVANNQLSAFGTIQSALASFRDSLTNLKTNLDFAVFKATSSDATVLDATTDSTASTGPHSIVVSQLARADISLTNSVHFTTSTDAMGSVAQNDAGGAASLTGTTLTFDLGSSTSPTKTFNVNVDFSTDSLETIKDRINSSTSNDFVTASVLNDGTGYRLVLTAKNTGADNKVFVSGDTNLAFGYTDQTKQEGVNATLSVDGINISKDSNTITDVIQGVTLNLKDVSTSTVTLKVDNDTDAITKKVNDFISAYNKLASTISDLHKKGGTLEADNSATSVIYQLQSVFNAPASLSGNAFSWLAQIGISFNKDGTLALDSTTFTNALGSNYNDVVALFSDSTQGFSQRLYTAASNMLDSSGLVQSRIDGLNTTINTIDANMDQMNVRLDNVEKRLRTQFANLDALLGTMRNTSSYLASQLSS